MSKHIVRPDFGHRLVDVGRGRRVGIHPANPSTSVVGAA